MNISELKVSRFLTKADCAKGLTLTIVDCRKINVAKEGERPELKHALHFQETVKPLVLNNVNGQAIAKITGSEDSEGWVGKQITLYVDDSVTFGGRTIGGIRVYVPPKIIVPAPAPVPADAGLAKEGPDDFNNRF